MQEVVLYLRFALISDLQFAEIYPRKQTIKNNIKRKEKKKRERKEKRRKKEEEEEEIAIKNITLNVYFIECEFSHNFFANKL